MVSAIDGIFLGKFISLYLICFTDCLENLALFSSPAVSAAFSEKGSTVRSL